MPKAHWTAAGRRCTLPPMGIPLFRDAELERLRVAGRAAAETLAWVTSRVVARHDHRGHRCAGARGHGATRRHAQPARLPGLSGRGLHQSQPRRVSRHPAARRRAARRRHRQRRRHHRLGGYHGDTSATFFVGEPSAAGPPRRRGRAALPRRRHRGGADGARLGDIGAAIEELARGAGLQRRARLRRSRHRSPMHAPPHVSHVGRRGTGSRLKAGHGVHHRADGEPRSARGARARRRLDGGDRRRQPLRAVRAHGRRDEGRVRGADGPSVPISGEPLPLRTPALARWMRLRSSG